MRLGVLDVGSNTINLLVMDARPGAGPVPAASHRSVLRLMRYLQADGSISEIGVRAIIVAIAEAAELALTLHLDAFLPMATSAIREATNGEEVLRRIHTETGVELQVLSGDEEAKLTFLAVRRWYGWSARNILVFDIGGGSLEISQGGDEYPEVSVSLPLGAGRTTVDFLHTDPPTASETQALTEHASSVIAEAAERFAHLPAPDHIVGSSKTIRSLAKLAGKQRSDEGRGARTTLSLRQLSGWVPRIALIPGNARHALPGITEDRAFQVAAGAIVLEQAMTVLGADRLEVSPWALREGVIMRYLDHLD